MLTCEAMIVGCLPPFKSFITSHSSSANYNYNYNYNSSGPAGNHYDRSGSSARIKKRSVTTGSWSGLPIQLQERNHDAYQNLEYEAQAKHDVHIAGGVNVRAVPPQDISRLSLSEDDSGHGEIRMVKEFVSISCLFLRLWDAKLMTHIERGDFKINPVQTQLHEYT
jgi:hypothetical protein